MSQVEQMQVQGVSRPYFLCVRPGMDGHYSKGGRSRYITHPLFAPDGRHYLRAYGVLLSDLLRLFEYVEPADSNEGTYSYRCLELLIRACGEVEANCRAILDANGYARDGQWNMADYRKLETTHRLSKYRIRLPSWRGARSARIPFDAWSTGKSLAWFDAHHGGKHNRHAEFERANLGNVVDAVAAVAVLLSAQLLNEDFGPAYMVCESSFDDAYESAVGGYLQVRFPDDWPLEQRYDFKWPDLEEAEEPFQKLFK
jgi:hypothetical protein